MRVGLDIGGTKMLGVAFDADDTLWRSEDSFDHAERRFRQRVEQVAVDALIETGTPQQHSLFIG